MSHIQKRIFYDGENISVEAYMEVTEGLNIPISTSDPKVGSLRINATSSELEWCSDTSVGWVSNSQEQEETSLVKNKVYVYSSTSLSQEDLLDTLVIIQATDTDFTISFGEIAEENNLRYTYFVKKGTHTVLFLNTSGEFLYSDSTNSTEFYLLSHGDSISMISCHDDNTYYIF